MYRGSAHAGGEVISGTFLVLRKRVETCKNYDLRGETAAGVFLWLSCGYNVCAVLLKRQRMARMTVSRHHVRH